MTKTDINLDWTRFERKKMCFVRFSMALVSIMYCRRRFSLLSFHFNLLCLLLFLSTENVIYYQTSHKTCGYIKIFCLIVHISLLSWWCLVAWEFMFKLFVGHRPNSIHFRYIFFDVVFFFKPKIQTRNKKEKKNHFIMRKEKWFIIFWVDFFFSVELVYLLNDIHNV